MNTLQQCSAEYNNGRKEIVSQLPYSIPSSIWSGIITKYFTVTSPYPKMNKKRILEVVKRNGLIFHQSNISIFSVVTRKNIIKVYLWKFLSSSFFIRNEDWAIPRTWYESRDSVNSDNLNTRYERKIYFLRILSVDGQENCMFFHLIACFSSNISPFYFFNSVFAIKGLFYRAFLLREDSALNEAISVSEDE